MIRGLYTSSLGMTTQMKKMDVISNNLANVATTGFKKDLAVTRPFSEELLKRLNDPSDMMKAADVGRLQPGVFVDDVYTNFSQGHFESTGNTFDLAIFGEGFFAVNVTDQNGNVSEKYTRDGAFTLDSNNALVTKDAGYVLGQNGPITVPNGQVTIDDNGNVYSNDVYVDTLRMVDFEDKHTLRKYGDNFYDVTPQSTEIAFTGRVNQGNLESSNVNAVREMVEMVSASRLYEANQRLISMHDTILGKISTELAAKQ